MLHSTIAKATEIHQQAGCTKLGELRLKQGSGYTIYYEEGYLAIVADHRYRYYCDSYDTAPLPPAPEVTVAPPTPTPLPVATVEPLPEPTPTAAPTLVDLTISWDHPIAREDGSALPASEIDSYYIAYMNNDGSMSIVAVPGSVNSVTIPDFPPGTYEFTINTVDTDGIVSAKSDPVTYVVE